MRAHASDAMIQVGTSCWWPFGVQELGCQALKEFAAFNSESASDMALHSLTGPYRALQDPFRNRSLHCVPCPGQEDIYVRGGIQVVLRAMEGYPELPNLQAQGLQGWSVSAR